MATKFVFVTGGVVSGLGKGTVAASLGRLLINRGLKVGVLKLDCYLNIDTSNMCPFRHGEVFVTDDGAECDLDVGHYERFIGTHYTSRVNHTMGKVYQSVLAKERSGFYNGRDVQVVPSVTDEIKHIIRDAGEGFDVLITEVGGTVGEIEGSTYIEAIRQFFFDVGRDGAMNIHVTLVPYLEASGEIKTKPTQNSVRDLRHMGINPNILICRTNKDVVLDMEAREKIALFCNLRDVGHVIHAPDCRSVYEVPINLKEQGFDDLVLGELGLKAPKDNLVEWKKMVNKMLDFSTKVAKKIAIVGKYVAVPDSYISVMEAVKHAGLSCDVKVDIKLVDSVEVEKQGADKLLSGVDAIIVPGGFGERGVEGKIIATKFARENNIPYLGICLGMQVAAIEFARNVCGIKNATSVEFNEDTDSPVINLMEEQKKAVGIGGTMRLGLFDCKLQAKSKVATVYGKVQIKERHRHRYEFNNAYREELAKAGLVFSGINEKSNLVEIIENPNCKYFVACQFHPEFVSKPYKAHPLFVGLVEASL